MQSLFDKLYTSTSKLFITYFCHLKSIHSRARLRLKKSIRVEVLKQAQDTYDDDKQDTDADKDGESIDVPSEDSEQTKVVSAAITS